MKSKRSLKMKCYLFKIRGVKNERKISVSISKIIVLLLLILYISDRLQAQSALSSDELFQQARTTAFGKKDYQKAIVLAKKALENSPDYFDIRIFLGRLYMWTDKYDLAKESFLYVLEKNPTSEDATMAITDLEYWNNHYDSALAFCNRGLEYNPYSEELLLKKGRILNALRRYKEAYTVMVNLTTKYPKNESARSLLESIRFDCSMNKVSLSDDFTWFDGNYGDYLHKYPWSILSLDYGRFTGIGCVIARTNYGSRFSKHTFQFELDAYPRLFKNMTAYVNIGISDQSAVFPRYRMGISLYACIPNNFEAESGFRLLHFSNSTWIYIAGISKYYKNFWFNGRANFVPDNKKISQSFSLTIRYYFGGADDYWKVGFGYGLSPDDINSMPSFISDYRLRSKQLSVGFRKTISKFNVIGFSVSELNQEFSKSMYGNQINTSVVYIKKF